MSFLTPHSENSFQKKFPKKERFFGVDVKLKKFSLQPQIIKFATIGENRQLIKLERRLCSKV